MRNDHGTPGTEKLFRYFDRPVTDHLISGPTLHEMSTISNKTQLKYHFQTLFPGCRGYILFIGLRHFILSYGDADSLLFWQIAMKNGHFSALCNWIFVPILNITDSSHKKTEICLWNSQRFVVCHCLLFSKNHDADHILLFDVSLLVQIFICAMLCINAL